MEDAFEAILGTPRSILSAAEVVLASEQRAMLSMPRLERSEVLRSRFETVL